MGALTKPKTPIQSPWSSLGFHLSSARRPFSWCNLVGHIGAEKIDAKLPAYEIIQMAPDSIDPHPPRNRDHWDVHRRTMHLDPADSIPPVRVRLSAGLATRFLSARNLQRPQIRDMMQHRSWCMKTVTCIVIGRDSQSTVVRPD